MSTVTSRTQSHTSSLSKQDVVDIEPDDTWKEALRARIEDGLSSMVAEVKKTLHDKLDKEPVSSSKREELTAEYHQSMNSIRSLAAEAFHNELERERQERRWMNGGEMLPQWNEALKQEQQDIMDRIKTQKEPTSSSSTHSRHESNSSPEMTPIEPDAEMQPKGPVPVELPPDLAQKREKQLREEREKKERKEKEKKRSGRQPKSTMRQDQEDKRAEEEEEEEAEVEMEMGHPKDRDESPHQPDLEPEPERERQFHSVRGMSSRRSSINRNPTSGRDEDSHLHSARLHQSHSGLAERPPPDASGSEGSSFESEGESLLRPPEQVNPSRKSSFHERSMDSPMNRSTDHLSRLPSERYPPRSPPMPHPPQYWKPSSPEEEIVNTRPSSAGLARRNSSTSIRSTGSGSHRPTITEPIPERSDSEAENTERRIRQPDQSWSASPPKPREKEKRREHRKSSASDQNRLEDSLPAFANSRPPLRHDDLYPSPQPVRERYEDLPSVANPRVQYRPDDIGPRLPSNLRPVHRKTSFTSQEWDPPYQTAHLRSVKSRPSFDDRYLQSHPPTPSGRVISRPPSIPSEEKERGFYEQPQHRSHQTPPASASRPAGREYAPQQGYYTSRTDSSPSYGYAESKSNTYKFAQLPESPPKRRPSENRSSQNRDPSYSKAFSEEPYQIQGSPLDSYHRPYDRTPSASIPISRRKHSPALEEAEGWKSWTPEVSASLPRRDMRWDAEWRGGYGYDREDLQQSREQDYPRRGERGYELWEPKREAEHNHGRQRGLPLESERREYARQVFSPSSSFPNNQHEVTNHSFGGRDHYHAIKGNLDDAGEEFDSEDIGPERESWENHSEQPDYHSVRLGDMRGMQEYRARETGRGQERSKKSTQRDRNEQEWKRESEIRRQEEERRQEEIRRQEEEEARRLEEEEMRRLEEEEEEARRLEEEEEARRLEEEEEERRLEEEARRREEEVRRNEEEAERRAEEARKLQRKAAEEAKKLEQKEVEIRRKELETKKKAAEVRKKEEEARKKEQEVKRKEAEAKRKEEEAKRKEEEAKRKEDDIRQKEEEAHRRELEAKNKEQEARKKEEEMRQKEEELKKREEELLRREQEIASQKEAERLQREWDLDEEQRRLDEKFRRDQEEFDRRAQEIRQKAEERKRQDSFGTESSWNSSSYTSSQSQRVHATSNGQAPGWNTSSARSSSKPSSTSGPSTPTSSIPKSRSGSINSTFPSFDENEWKRRNEEQYQKQQERFREEQQRYETARQRAQSGVLSKEEAISWFSHHDRLWSTLISSSPGDLHWESIPWPTFKPPKSPEDISMGAVSAYMQSPHFPEKDKSKSYKDRLKEHIRRWHPDRFDTKYLPRVVEEDREKVKDGAGSVVRTLNELLTRSNAPSLFS